MEDYSNEHGLIIFCGFDYRAEYSDRSVFWHLATVICSKGQPAVDIATCPGALWAESLCHSGLWQILSGSDMESSHWPSIIPSLVILLYFLPIMSHNPASSLTSVPPCLLLQTGPLRRKHWPLHTASASIGPWASSSPFPVFMLILSFGCWKCSLQCKGLVSYSDL